MLSDECIGVGGIFFELSATANQEGYYNFLVDCIKTVIPCYMPLVQKHASDAYTEKQRKWLQIRRGRYVFVFSSFTNSQDNSKKPLLGQFKLLSGRIFLHPCMKVVFIANGVKRILTLLRYLNHSPNL